MQSQLKVLAPVMTRDVTLPNSSKKVPMVMVPVPDSKTLMAIPLSTINNMTGVKDEQQAKDILNWNDDGIGTLDGCDLRFRINQLGCLELLDSDDEADYDQTDFTTYHHLKGKSQQQQHRNYNNNSCNNNNNNRAPPPPVRTLHFQSKQIHSQQDINDQISTCNNRTHSQQNNNSSTNSSNSNNNNNNNNNNNKKAKIKQISPGCSLLRDGPDTRRARAPSSSASTQSSGSSTLPLSTRRNESATNLVLLEKLIPKKQIEELKTKVENWSVEDVKLFVDSLPGCSGSGHLFEAQQICGKSLLHLDQKDLVDIVNVKLGPAIKIYNVISLIKS
uniref:Lethal(3)malignant brain tumor-like protein 3 n=1 Tax=Aceria tosichella TaxID=561515 RepID=A0A6G1SCM0_9ACAR